MAPVGGKYNRFFGTDVNPSGQVAFIADMFDGSQLLSAIYCTNGQTLATVALEGTPAPAGGNYRYNMGAIDLNSNGQIAYWSQLTDSSSPVGIFRYDGATSSAVALQGTSAPTGANYGAFTLLSVVIWPKLSSGGQVAYWANLSGGPNSHGIFLNNGLTTTAVAVSGTAAPAGGNYSGFLTTQSTSYRLSSTGYLAYRTNLTGGSSTQGVFVYDGITSQPAALQGTAAPAGGDFNAFDFVEINSNGQVVYKATLTGGTSSSGVFLRDGNTTTPVVLSGTATPVGGNFSNNSQWLQLDSSGDVAFWSSMDNGSHGIFRYNGTTIDPVACAGAAAPGTTSTFSTIASITGFAFKMNDAGMAALYASLTPSGDVTSANDTGLWFGTNANDLSLLAREGDQMFVNGANRTLANLPTTFSLSEHGVAWQASFTDNSSAIIYSEFVTVPEPKSVFLLAVIAATCVTVWPRARTKSQ